MILQAEADKQATILAAEAQKERMLKEAEGRAEAIRKVQEANADGIRMIREAGADDAVLTLKSLEAFAQAADGKATKIIIPSEIQGIAGLAASLKGIADGSAAVEKAAPAAAQQTSGQGRINRGNLTVGEPKTLA
jgi:regulator of protease activity HflC (stomatin/prohibitin superfamily)